MDAFAVSICKGLQMKKITLKNMLLIAVFFGGFQGLMPLIGWFLGIGLEGYIKAVDHWIAFGLLLFIGIKMIIDAKKDEAVPLNKKELDIKELLVLSVATSIDALAVGITFAFLNVPILKPVTMIGVITASLSAMGVFIGFRFGERYKTKAQIAGGIVLIIIGVKILLEHLGIIGG